MDFEQLAFIEKWRRRASRGNVVALDASRGDPLLTLRVGEFGESRDLRGRDETGAIRKQRLSLGDRVFAAFRYRVSEVTPATGATAARFIVKGAEVEGTLNPSGDLFEVDVDGVVTLIVEGDESLAAFSAGDRIRFRITDDGRAYVIPTR